MVEYGGGDREDALAAGEVMGRSKMGRDDVYSALPEVMKVSTATGADARDVATLMTSTYNFGFKDEQARAALDAATTASQHGKADVALLSREAPRGSRTPNQQDLAVKKALRMYLRCMRSLPLWPVLRMRVLPIPTILSLSCHR